MLVSPHISVPSLSYCPLYSPPLMQDNSFYDYLVTHRSVEGRGCAGGEGGCSIGGWSAVDLPS